MFFKVQNGEQITAHGDAKHALAFQNDSGLDCKFFFSPQSPGLQSCKYSSSSDWPCLDALQIANVINWNTLWFDVI
jgi:hypothetical protein